MSAELGSPVDVEPVLPDFDRRFPMEMAILRIGLVYPGTLREWEDAENPYTHKLDLNRDGNDVDYYGNIGVESIAVGKAAEVLSDHFMGPNHLLRDYIISRAVKEDSAKAYEVMRDKKKKEIIAEEGKEAGKKFDVYSPRAYETIKPILQAKGVAPEIIEEMANSGYETGHISFPIFLTMENGEPALNTERTPEEMIVHYADDMTFTLSDGNVYYGTVKDKQEARNFPARYPDLYTNGIGFDKDGNVIEIKDVNDQEETEGLQHVKILAEWHLWVADEIAKYLVSWLDEEPDMDPQEYISQVVRSALTKQSA